MADLVIRFRRPATVPDGEEQTWMTTRLRDRGAGVARRADAPGGFVLRVPVPPASTEDRLARLLLEGTLRPT